MRILLLAILLLLHINPIQAQQTVGKVVPNKQWQFPQDHWLHPEFGSEWWYVTSNLRDKQGNHYGAQFTLFTNKLEFHNQDHRIFFAHAALSSKDSFYHGERYAREDMQLAGVEPAPFRAFIDHWQMLGTDSAPLPAKLTVLEDKFGYDLQLSAAPYFLQGDKGFSIKNRQGTLASYYYNTPFIKVSGKIRIENQWIEVTGDGWLDREWSTGIFTGKDLQNTTTALINQVGWDWLSLHLSPDQALMLYRVHNEDHIFLTGTIMNKDGSQIKLTADQINWQVIEYKEFRGAKYPIRWQLEIPKHQIKLKLDPINPNQYHNSSIPYWEGAMLFEGSHQGQGYLELFGYETNNTNSHIKPNM